MTSTQNPPVASLGDYDVAVVGAGMTGVVAAITAARDGARTVLVESSGLIGGLVTGGRLTKPTGLVQAGVYRELIEAAGGYGGADLATRHSYWGAYTGVFDAEVMQRVIIEALDAARVDVLLFSTVTGVQRDESGWVRGLELLTKAGAGALRAHTTVDASGDGDVAVLAGARYELGRAGDGETQPMTSYFRILGVDFPELMADLRSHPADVQELVAPNGCAGDEDSGVNEAYAMTFFMTGLATRIADAQAQGFEWIVPRSTLTMKAGMLPGEMNVNSTRVQGNALDPWQRSRAVIEIRRQAYCTFDFLTRHVGGFSRAVLLDIAPVLGVRETRRVVGDYTLSETDVRGEARFPDAIGLCNAPIDIHEPGGHRAIMDGVGEGYGIPYRTLLPSGVANLLVAGRCISADHVAFGSTRNTPACALTGQAAGHSAALASARGVTPRDLEVTEVQERMARAGIRLGCSSDEHFSDSST